MGTSQNKTLFNDYEGFVEKFRPKKTTDDCYTPPEVYAAVLDYVRSIADIEGRPIVRPFYPGGDYEHYDYPENCVVVDNPPFSILAKICRDYLARGIDFFLFAPTATLICKMDLCHVLTGCRLVYENGAEVRTSFRTTLLPGMRLVTAPELERALMEADRAFMRKVGLKQNKAFQSNDYPHNVLMPMTAMKFVEDGMRLEIRSDECCVIKALDAIGPTYGHGLLLSTEAAARKEAAEEAAHEARRTKVGARHNEKRTVPLSEREERMVRILDAQKGGDGRWE